ncbi:MAG: hypothetical protein ACREJO_13045 [Phycisphaerales bacterium]
MPNDHADLAALRDHIAANDSVCPACSYRLAGLPEVRCPECGKPITLEALVENEAGVADTNDHFGNFITFVLGCLFLLALCTSSIGLVGGISGLMESIQSRNPIARLAAGFLSIAFGVLPFYFVWLGFRWLERRRQQRHRQG